MLASLIELEDEQQPAEPQALVASCLRTCFPDVSE